MIKKSILHFLFSALVCGSAAANGVASPPPGCPTIIGSGVDVSCYGDFDGSATITLSTPSTGPYIYTWSNGFQESGTMTTSTISNLYAGGYTVNVKDITTGCVVVGAIVVNSPDPLTVSGVVTDLACNGVSTGTVVTNVNGGTPLYSYNWTGPSPQTSPNLSSAAAGSYTLVVTDASACTDTVDFTIDEPNAALDASSIVIEPGCFGATDGSIDISVWGGTTSYTYVWNTSATTQDITGIGTGFYDLTITDANGCTDYLSFNLSQPAQLTGSVSKTDVLCFGDATGNLAFSPGGGTPGYTYQWSNTSTLFAETGPNLINIPSDNYVVTVTDSKGCQLTILGTNVGEPPVISLSTVATAVNCNGGSDGSATASVTGGTTPYSYLWSNAAATASITGVAAGTYTVTASDGTSSCEDTYSNVVISEPTALAQTNLVTDACFGTSTGSIDVTVTGGTAPYTYSWSNGATTEDLLNVPADIYQVLVTDTKGCMDSITVDISEPAPISMTFDVIDISCNDQSDGIAYVYPAGGNDGYTYSWSNGEIEDINTGLSNQYYWITVTDILGCTGTDSVFIPRDTIGCIDPVTAFSPNGDNYNDTWVIDNMELYPNAEVQIFNKWGNRIHHRVGYYEPWDGTSHGEQSPAALYYWIINVNQPDREVLKGTITILR